MTVILWMMTEIIMLTTVDVYVDAWYINHMIKDVKINIHVLFMMFMICYMLWIGCSVNFVYQSRTYMGVLRDHHSFDDYVVRQDHQFDIDITTYMI